LIDKENKVNQIDLLKKSIAKTQID
jgi:hypothetical protein